MTELLCPKCGTEMGMGIAIDAGPNRGLTIISQAPLNAETLRLIECFKCPKCGYSDDGEELQTTLRKILTREDIREILTQYKPNVTDEDVERVWIRCDNPWIAERVYKLRRVDNGR